MLSVSRLYQAKAKAGQVALKIANRIVDIWARIELW